MAQKERLFCTCDLLTNAQTTNLSPQMIASIPKLWAASKQPPALITKSPAYHGNAIFPLMNQAEVGITPQVTLVSGPTPSSLSWI